MKIIINSISADNTEIEYLIERELGTYNNIVETVKLTTAEIAGLTVDEIKTLGFKRIKHVAVRVFEQIEPLAETDNPIGFTLVASVPKRIEVQGSNTLRVGDSAEYFANVFDQYGEITNDVITWTNKTVNATVEGIVKVTASVGIITDFIDVEIIPYTPSREEIIIKQLAEEKLKNIQNNNTISELTTQLASVKLDVITMKGSAI